MFEFIQQFQNMSLPADLTLSWLKDGEDIHEIDAH